MTDYNDGQIHGWNGGDCPVHPETEVQVWFRSGVGSVCQLYWGHDGSDLDIIAFRVVKEYVEPKVVWVNEGKKGFKAYATEAEARKYVRPEHVRIAVKYQEVKE